MVIFRRIILFLSSGHNHSGLRSKVITSQKLNLLCGLNKHDALFGIFNCKLTTQITILYRPLVKSKGVTSRCIKVIGKVEAEDNGR